MTDVMLCCDLAWLRGWQEVRPCWIMPGFSHQMPQAVCPSGGSSISQIAILFTFLRYQGSYVPGSELSVAGSKDAHKQYREAVFPFQIQKLTVEDWLSRGPGDTCNLNSSSRYNLHLLTADLPVCVPFGTSFHLHGPQFSHLYMGTVVRVCASWDK